MTIITDYGCNCKRELEHPPKKEDFFMQMNNRTRYTLEEIQRNTFYQMPKFLFEGEFRALNNDARMLYALLRDRHDLSTKNGWVNEKGEVYLIFSRENMCEMLGLSDKPVTKAMNDLKKIGLAEEQRQGMGRPNLIYLLNPTTLDFTKTRRISDSRNVNSPSLESANLRPNDTNINNTYYSNTESQSQSQSQNRTVEIEHPQPSQEASNYADALNGQEYHPDLENDAIKINDSNKVHIPEKTWDYETCRKILQENFGFDRYLREEDRELVGELIDCALDVICTQGGTVRINGEDKNRELVKSQYMKLSSEDIGHVICRYKAQKHEIKHVHNYLKTMLYTVRQENGFYNVNAVRVDGWA